MILHPTLRLSTCIDEEMIVTLLSSYVMRWFSAKIFMESYLARVLYLSYQRTILARPREWMKRLKPRSAGVVFLSSPSDSMSTACTTIW